MKFPNEFIEELSSHKYKYFLMSGGVHSASGALLLKDYGFDDIILIHNDTGLVMKSSKETIERVIDYTDYEIIYVIPNLKQPLMDLMRNCFKVIPEVMEDIRAKRKYDRSKFKCCYELKKRPIRRFYKVINMEIDDSCVISCLCPYESQNRGKWLSEMRENDTYLREHTKYFGIHFLYPFRDEFKHSDFMDYLRSKGFGKTTRSACVFCPIVLAWRKYKAPNYYKSLKAYSKTNLPCFNGMLRTLDEYI